MDGAAEWGGLCDNKGNGADDAELGAALWNRKG
jgi:hypothetical protein